MRILMLANARAVHTRRWATAYAARGHDVHVISIRGADIPSATVHRIGVGPPDSDARWLALLSYARLLLSAKGRMRRLRPDVVHAHYTITHGTIAAFAGLRPLVVTAWGSDALWRRQDRSPLWFRLLNRLALRNADAATGASAYLSRQIQAHAPKARVFEVPFGVDTDRFRPEEGSREREAPLRIVFVKALDAKYGAEHLIRAMPAVLKALPGTQLSLAGRGRLERPLRALASELGVAGQVEFLGFVPHEAVPDLLRGSDILVNPSIVPESFGVAVLEAAACGLPTVATRVGGVPEVCRDGETGLLVPPNDPTALSRAIVRLGRDPELRARLGEAGRRFVVCNFEWDRSVDRMLEVLEQAGEAGNKPRTHVAVTSEMGSDL